MKIPLFLSELKVTEKSDTEHQGRGTWQLISPLMFYSVIINKIIVVPKGFITDFESVPRLPFIFWALGDRVTKPSVLHDFLYSRNSNLNLTRKICDRIFLEAMFSEKISAIYAVTIYSGVRIFGERFFKKLG